ncbi:MAG: hypothetical protein PVG01_08130, partial [Desulfobacterales bacterium]
MSVYYSVVYQGKILEGFDFEAAKNKLIEKFALNKEKAEKVLRSRRVVLKKAVDEMTARKLGLALKRAGLDVILTKSHTTAAVQPVTVGSGSKTEPRADKIELPPTAALDRQVDSAASAAAVEQTPVPKTAVIPF